MVQATYGAMKRFVLGHRAYQPWLSDTPPGWVGNGSARGQASCPNELERLLLIGRYQ